MRRAPRAWLTGLLAAALAACAPAGTSPSPAVQDSSNLASPDAGAHGSDGAATGAAASREASAEPAPVAAPAPKQAGVTTPDPATPPSLACTSDADCAVKDVGSCCGYRPACVNAQAETHPEDVKARCAAEGRVGSCGFAAIESCQCLAGRCAAAGGALPTVQGPAPPQVLQ